jgi:hypothetical protein
MPKVCEKRRIFTLAVGSVLAGCCAMTAAFAASTAATTSQDRVLAPCEGLAKLARTVPPAAWADGAKALAPMLQIDTPQPASDPRYTRKPLSGFEMSLAHLPFVQEGLGAEGGSWTVFIDHLSGTDIYAASTFQGTLHCQTTVYLKASASRPPRQIASPPSDDDELCWTQSAELGRVAGRPAVIEHGARSQTDWDEDIRITPLVGEAWWRGCRLSLTYRTDYTVTDRLCADASVCAGAERVVQDVALAYNRKREDDSDNTVFTFGPPPSLEMKATLKHVVDSLDGSRTLDFPQHLDIRGGGGFSYSGFAVFSLRVGTRDYIAAIGHEGVGWREGANTLLAIYDTQGEKPVPIAGFVVTRRISGLDSAVAGLDTRGDQSP